MLAITTVAALDLWLFKKLIEDADVVGIYGAAHLLEDTGLGLGKPLGRLTFKLFAW